MIDATPDPGVCPSCGQRGETGTPCSERVCQRRDYRYIPGEHAQRLVKTGPRATNPLIGQVLAGYLVVDIIGDGGFGLVYLALQLPIRRRPLQVALKLMKRGLAADPATGEQVMGKFEGEADALAALSHPNVVRLLGYGSHEGTPYIVMEYVDHARTLREETAQRAARSGHFAADEVAHILKQALHGLEAAHRQEIVHRDIKPDNIMLQEVAGDPMLVRLLDFGLAKFVDERTRTSMTAGTPMYMAPEQLRQGRIGPWTDLYALGVIAFELLTGERAFSGTYQEVCARKLDPTHDPLTDAQAAALPVAVATFLRRALAGDPEARYRSSDAMRAGLDEAFAALRGPVAAAPVALDGLITPSDSKPEDHAEVGALDRTTPAGEGLATPAPHLDDEAWLSAAPTTDSRPARTTAPQAQHEATSVAAGGPQHSRARVLVLAGVGLAVFLLMAAWIALGTAPNVTRFMLVGGPSVVPGLTASFRVGVSGGDEDNPVTPEVRRVRVDGSAMQGETRGAGWRIVPFLVPRSAKSVIRLSFDASTEDAKSAIDVEIPVQRLETAVPPPLDPAASGLVTGGNRIAALPESGVLVAGMENRVFVRVRDANGVPMDGATVRIQHPSLDGGEAQRVSDASGLVDFTLRAQQISYMLRIDVRREREQFSAEIVLSAVGRQMTLTPAEASTPIGVKPRVRLTTWQPEAPVFCELLLGDVVLWSDAVRTTLHAAEISPDPLPMGRYDLQCYDHALSPGEAYASVPIIVADGEPMAAVLAHVHASGLSERTTAFGNGRVAPGRASDFWLSVLRRPLVVPRLIANTGPEAERAMVADRKTSRAYVVAALGVVLALFIIWLVDGLLRSRIDSRERLRDLALDETSGRPDLGDAGLIRARRLMAVLLIGGAILVNGLAIFWLVQSLF
ncbi:MAG: serine/threonine-protein kinase [Myxococcota bacterium]